MRPMMRALLFSFVVAACGGGSAKPVVKPEEPKPDPIPMTAGPTCKAVGEQIVTFNDMSADLKSKAAALVETRCTDDKWTDEARSCFATATNGGEGEACAKEKLTKDQILAFERDIEALMTAEGGAEAKKAQEPPEAPKPKAGKGTTRGVKQKPKGGDPCQGGESDPCQGGQ
jgi:hypothetical protein